MSEFLIDQYGNTIWYDAKSYNKEDILYYNIWFEIRYPNEQKFYIRPHRENGPAIIWYGQTEIYYIKGLVHCEDGPAKIWSNNYIQWWFNDKFYLFEDWCKKLNKSEEEINFLKLKWNII